MSCPGRSQDNHHLWWRAGSLRASQPMTGEGWSPPTNDSQRMGEARPRSSLCHQRYLWCCTCPSISSSALPVPDCHQLSSQHCCQCCQSCQSIRTGSWQLPGISSANISTAVSQAAQSAHNAEHFFVELNHEQMDLILLILSIKN